MPAEDTPRLPRGTPWTRIGVRCAKTSCARTRSPNLSRTVRVAAFVSPALERLGSSLGFPVAIVAVTGDPEAHVAGLARRHHACWSLAEDWAFDGVGGREEDPFRPDFRQLMFDPRWLGGRRPPAGVAVDAGSILVALPRGLASEHFSAELKRSLMPRRYDVYGARPGLVRRRRAMGRFAVVEPRYAWFPSAGNGATGFKLVDDLYAFRPKSLPFLVAASAASLRRASALCAVERLLRAS